MGAAAEEPQPAVPGRSEGEVRADAAPVMENTKAQIGEAVGLKGKKWNTEKLGSRLAVDGMTAATAGGLVSPLIMVVDKYVFPPPCHKSGLSDREGFFGRMEYEEC